MKGICVRGFHVYEDIWEVAVWEVFDCEREAGSAKDRYTAAVQKDVTQSSSILQLSRRNPATACCEAYLSMSARSLGL